MAFCNQCGNKLQEGSKFCNHCGAPAVIIGDNTKTQRETIYDGKIYKCPNCGKILDAFESICPACNYELRGVKTTSCVNELAQKLSKADTVEQKIDLISNFYIPNTKEDISEFFILAISNINVGGYAVDAWLTKLEQTYHKAKLSFGNTPEFSYLHELYMKAEKQKRTILLHRLLSKSWTLLLGIALFVIGIYLFVFGQFRGAETGDSNSPFYAMGAMGIFPIMGGIALFVVGIVKNTKMSESVESETDNEEEEE